jgi:hypothetical protein
MALARMAERKADVNQAIAHYRKAAAIDGGGSEAAKRLALLRKVVE